MKDVTATSFGLLIAFLLPGLTALFGLAFWSRTARRTLEAFLNSPSNVGLFFLVVLAGLAMVLLETVPRWLIFERQLCRKYPLGRIDFEKLT